MRRTTIAGAMEPPSNPPKRVEAMRPALSASNRRGRPPCLPEQGGIASREIFQKSDSKFNKLFLLHGFKDNTNNTNTRMRRMKLNRGGDGDAHHRSTSDGGCHDKRVCQCKPQSNVRFRTRNRPPPSNFVCIIRKKKEFLINSWEFMIISVEEKKSE